MTRLNFDNSYVRDLEGFYAGVAPSIYPDANLVLFNTSLAEELGIDANLLNADMLSGAAAPEGAAMIAMVYAGHQFGGFSPQLGDGRALLLGEVIDLNGARFDIHLKGSGRTVFSRGGDGKAVLGPVLREYLMGEAMHAMGIPTTRALAAVSTGERILRDTIKPGAVLARVASSHIRVGTFQYFNAQGEHDNVRKLADYTINRHFPELKNSENPYLDLLHVVIDQQASLIAKWMNIGFVHGVMNTDNVAISGETIDYGPCAFMDRYDLKTVFSSIDAHGRYAYGKQPVMAHWNLARFAETLVPLLHVEEEVAFKMASHAIDSFQDRYTYHWLQGLFAKLGIHDPEPTDRELIAEMFEAMEGQNVDFTSFFRKLSNVLTGDDVVLDLFDDDTKAQDWLGRWAARVNDPNIAAEMNMINPLYIPRNHLVDEALIAAESDGDMSLFEKLLDILANPFVEREGFEKYAEPAPIDATDFRTYCGT